MLLNYSTAFYIVGFLVNFIAIIILIGKLGSFIGTVNNSLKFYEKRLDRLESHMFNKQI